jgi:hypothetical protein
MNALEFRNKKLRSGVLKQMKIQAKLYIGSNRNVYFYKWCREFQKIIEFK